MANEDASRPIPAFVLAGAPAEPEFEARFGVKYRCDAPVAGRTMLRRVVDALSESPGIRGIYVIGHTDPGGGATLVEPRGSFVENLILAAEVERDAERLLVVTSDIPMLTPDAITDFIERGRETDADLCYPIIPRDVNERRFPGMHRTYARLAEGTFTGGNAVILNPQIIIRNSAVIGDVLSARKHLMKMARIIGFGVLVRAVLAQKVWPGALPLRRLESVVGRILNGQAAVLVVEYPEVGADVDTPEQAEIIERIIASKGEAK